MPQTFIKVVSTIAFAAILSSCSGGEITTPHISSEKPVQKDISDTSEVLTRRLVVQCPLEISKYQEWKFEKNHSLTVIGLCPNDGAFPSDLILRSDISGGLSLSSQFTVSNSKYDTTSLTQFFVLDQATSSFVLKKERAEEMWGALEIGKYVFSANIISEDWEIADGFSFGFEIK